MMRWLVLAIVAAGGPGGIANAADRKREIKAPS
jgi:hypothetical protein